MDHRQQLDPRRRRAIHRRDPRLDHLRRHGLDRHRPKRRQDPRPEQGSVRRDRGRLAHPIMLDVAQPFRRRVGERHARPHHPRQRPPPRLVDQLPQPVLGKTLGHLAGGRAPSAGPRQADLLLNLAPVGEAIFRLPDGSARPFDAKDVACRQSRLSGRGMKRMSSRGHIGDIFAEAVAPSKEKDLFSGPFPKPSHGLEPWTPSLPWKCSTS
jgi:hypothetical protein